MELPKTAEEARQRGWRKATDEEVAKMKADKRSKHNGESPEGYMCYEGPCSNGQRTICYNNGGGCSDCYTSSEGC